MLCDSRQHDGLLSIELGRPMDTSEAYRERQASESVAE